MKKKEIMIVTIKDKGTCALKIKYNIGLARDMRIKINAYDLAKLVEMLGTRNLNEAGIKLCARVTFEDGSQRPQEVTLPEEAMQATPAQLREMGKLEQ